MTAALQRRDVATAIAIVKGWPEASPCLVAQVAQMAGDTASEEAALHKALAQNPRNIGALLDMGDMKQRLSDDRAATSFFRTALAQAMVTPQPPEMAPFLQRAQQWVEQASARFESHLRDTLGDAANLPRLSHALDLLTLVESIVENPMSASPAPTSFTLSTDPPVTSAVTCMPATFCVRTRAMPPP